MTASQKFMLKVLTFLLFGITAVGVHYFLNAVQHQSNGEIQCTGCPTAENYRIFNNENPTAFIRPPKPRLTFHLTKIKDDPEVT